MVIANTPEVPSLLHLDGVAARAVYTADRNNWAPRFGFASSLTSKTVVRGGYGIFYTNPQIS